MKCPICHRTRKMQVQKTYNGPLIIEDEPLYQFSSPGNKEYLPPRCLDCFDKAMKKRNKAVEKL